MRSTHLVGARTHNLRGVDLDLHPGELTVLTGVSGAGKSSLALDTLYAEGQRRFIESFSPYARQFLERLERPPVDELDPVPAGVAVDRRAPVKSSRSTVATMADLEPYLSALFTREARPVCGECRLEASWSDPKAAADRVRRELPDSRAIVTYPVRFGGTAEYLEVREALQRDGYRRLLVGGVVRDVDSVKPSELPRGEASVVVDRIDISKGGTRLAAAVEEAWRRGEGAAEVTSGSEGSPWRAASRARSARGRSSPRARRSSPINLRSGRAPLAAASAERSASTGARWWPIRRRRCGAGRSAPGRAHRRSGSAACS